MAYNEIDPIGSWRDDYRMSYMASLLTNISIRTNGKRGAKLSSVDDFLLIWDKEAKEQAKHVQSVEEMKKHLMTIAKTQNKAAEKNRKRTKPPVKK